MTFNIALTWPGSGVLQSSTNLVDGFVNVSGAASPYTNSITSAPQMFFRFRLVSSYSAGKMPAAR